MTFEEVLTAIEGRKICRHHFRAFFLVYTSEEAAHFKELGAYVSPAGGHDNEWGAPCWEVDPVGMLDPMPEENEHGEPIDLRREFLLNYFRERDGYALSVLKPL